MILLLMMSSPDYLMLGFGFIYRRGEAIFSLLSSPLFSSLPSPPPVLVYSQPDGAEGSPTADVQLFGK